ncbi:MAG: magnesium-translocating P-type ATPase [Anaerolineaceae bacterium]|nr:magnesium-translocating P-type ATPase [Anaerolineaceae bacterium]
MVFFKNKAIQNNGAPKSSIFADHPLLGVSAYATEAQSLKNLDSSMAGLSAEEAELRFVKYGPNEVGKSKHQSDLWRLLKNFENPLVILLILLGLISYFTGDLRSTAVIFVMVILGVVLKFFQERRADNAAEKLQEMVNTTATVFRDGQQSEIPLKELVPGDLVILGAGDMVPADLRILTCKDLFLNQSALTGESLPVEKTANPVPPDQKNTLQFDNLCFFGSNVESGTAQALVVTTGKDTYFGNLASSITSDKRVETCFEKGINRFTWLMIGFMAVLVPLVFLINGLVKHDWLQAFLFAIAVAVGLTPEMLPMIVTVNLSRGAIDMSRQKVIVKKLEAIQNFGAMDLLCTDKTGTITEGKIVLEKHLDVRGNESERVLVYGYLNSYYQTGLRNLMDAAILDHVEVNDSYEVDEKYTKVDELPFDFQRRRMSVIVETNDKQRILICKGAVEEVMSLCSQVENQGEILDVLPEHDARRKERVRELNSEGYRVIAVAYKILSDTNLEPHYSIEDESNMVLLGFLAFLDPPKTSATEALEALNRHKVSVKILTGDNDAVTAFICKQVGMPADKILLGEDLDHMDDASLAKAAEACSVFAKLSPAHKERIIRSLRSNDHVVGFMGDGINDAPALRAADVGISVDSAVDIAKESSDIILLENSLLVLEQGVMAGRRVFGNIIKYIKMAASSNFGNMFSMLGASILLPFLPMKPIQILTNNLLYDFSQTAIPSDQVDTEWLEKPRKWALGELRRFIMVIGPISSIFDYLTFALMWFVFKANNLEMQSLFQTGWFVESIFTQTLIVHVIRTNKVPFIQSRASKQLLLTSLLIVSLAAVLPYSPLAPALGLMPLPGLYWLFLAFFMLAYMGLTQIVKTWFIKKYGD